MINYELRITNWAGGKFPRRNNPAIPAAAVNRHSFPHHRHSRESGNPHHRRHNRHPAARHPQPRPFPPYTVIPAKAGIHTYHYHKQHPALTRPFPHYLSSSPPQSGIHPTAARHPTSTRPLPPPPYRHSRESGNPPARRNNHHPAAARHPAQPRPLPPRRIVITTKEGIHPATATTNIPVIPAHSRGAYSASSSDWRARVAPSTRAAPAAFSTAAHSPSVLPVVATSSTSSTEAPASS